jgi:hypothetical protein
MTTGSAANAQHRTGRTKYVAAEAALRCPFCWHEIGRHERTGFILHSLYLRVVPETRQIMVVRLGCHQEIPLGKLVVHEPMVR